jgi:hypothetical protein
MAEQSGTDRRKCAHESCRCLVSHGQNSAVIIALLQMMLKRPRYRAQVSASAVILLARKLKEGAGIEFMPPVVASVPEERHHA